MISYRAAAVAVIVAFVAGLIGSLALRPPGGAGSASSAGNFESAVRVRWRVPVSYAANLPVLGENPVYVADAVRRASNGAVRLDLFEPGELVPAFSIVDAVRDKKVPAGYTWLGYDQGKLSATALLGAVPFGMEPSAYVAWWYHGNGQTLADGALRTLGRDRPPLRHHRARRLRAGSGSGSSVSRTSTV